jgi:hypothetical protein
VTEFDSRRLLSARGKPDFQPAFRTAEDTPGVALSVDPALEKAPSQTAAVERPKPTEASGKDSIADQNVTGMPQLRNNQGSFLLVRKS